ncbi:hypothetical protein EDF87_12570 [Pseudomonas helmanticensis]|uniref:Uncharacterized protein n=1 Tax=Pseudomonas helmanticensis TaxID=1471381 RepID=A0A4R7UU40_9PSED|nr:hypothetical protein [Pseudomonas helmanticensis]TDV37534.1 hypothetical protein EDF87_12570 [Pseudomonas helmanticensis]
MKTNSSCLPVYIELPVQTLLENGAFFVRLRTLDELEEFWRTHQDKFAYACEGKGSEKPCFLNEYEWVFGNTKASVVRTVLRWGKSGISCEFYDWAKNDPLMHEMFFLDRDADRRSMIEIGRWSEKDEAYFHADCARRSSETYRGWWRFCNLPNGYSANEWLNCSQGHEELIDPHMDCTDVETILHENTFDDWRQSDCWEIESHDVESIDEIILYWKNERAKGEGYYGDENVSLESDN